MANDNLKKYLDTVTMIVMLLLVSHFFSCIWILIGQHQLINLDDGWIKDNQGEGLIQPDNTND